tara:strand:- start:2548 stop:3555 length:1008 start_codon:yes stop_codon:yes gene_type:complete
MNHLRKKIRQLILEYAENFNDLPDIWQKWFSENEDELELEWIPNKGFERKPQSKEEYEKAFPSDKRKGRHIIFPRELPGGDMLSMAWIEEQDPKHGYFDKKDPAKYWKIRREEGRKLKKQWSKKTYEPNKEFFDSLIYVTWIRSGRGKNKVSTMESLLIGDTSSEISVMFYDAPPLFFSRAMWLGAIVKGRPTFMSNINAHTGNYQAISDENVEADDPYLWFFSKDRKRSSGAQKYPALGYKSSSQQSTIKDARVWDPKDIDYSVIRRMQQGNAKTKGLGGGNNEVIMDNWRIEKLIMTSNAPITAEPFVYDLAKSYGIPVVDEQNISIYPDLEI